MRGKSGGTGGHGQSQRVAEGCNSLSIDGRKIGAGPRSLWAPIIAFIAAPIVVLDSYFDPRRIPATLRAP